MAFKKTVLENGLRIITAPQPGNLAVTVLVLVETGSQYETKEISGLSHFLEHMCFKGTKKRPSSIEINNELDSMGGSHNAFTSFEYTGYYAKAEAKNFDKVLDIVSDIYLNPTFPPEEIDKERGAIIQEMNMIEDDPRRNIGDAFVRLLYGDTPAGRDSIGPKENIMKLSREDFIKYRTEHYLAESTIVIVAGSCDEKEAIEKIKLAFKDIPPGKKGKMFKAVDAQTKPEILIKQKASDQLHTILGFRAFDIFDERRYALYVMSSILGSGMSSRLFEKVRAQLGAAYYVYSGVDFYVDHGYLAVSAGLDKDKLYEAIKAILVELGRMKEELVGAKELEKVKSHIAGSIILGLETSDSLASFYGDQELLEKTIIPPEELLKRINAVTAEQIRDVARDVIKNEGLNLAIIGSVKDDAKLRSLLKID